MGSFSCGVIGCFFELCLYLRFYNDSRVWSPSSNGSFSSNSFYHVLSKEPLQPLSQSSYPFQNVWKSVAPPPVKAFNWIASLGRQNTMDVLQRRRSNRIMQPSMCSLCGLDSEIGDQISY